MPPGTLKHGIFLSLGVTAIAIIGHWAGLSRTDWPAWLQAIGSVAAIYYAYHLGERQAEKSQAAAVRLQDRADARKSLAFLAICSVASKNTENIEAVFCALPYDGFRRFATFQIEESKSIIRALQAIPIHEIGSAIAVVAILELENKMLELLRYIAVFDSPLPDYIEAQPNGREFEQERRRNDIGRTAYQIYGCFDTLEVELTPAI